ncbi:unnamed protein product [Closterium sp. NIES-54]
MVSHLRCNDSDSAGVNAVADPVAGDENESHDSDATNGRSGMDGGGVSSVVNGRNCKSDTILVGEIADHLSLPGDALADHRHEEFRVRELATEATNSCGELEEEPSEQQQEELQRQQPHQQTQQNEQQNRQRKLQQQQQQQQQQGRRAFCVECHKATSVCICDRFGEPVDNRVGVTILQHPKEKYHPLGSARIALLGLQRVGVVVVPLGRGRPGLQPKDPCSRRSLLGRSGRGRWRKGAGKTLIQGRNQGGGQGGGPGEEKMQGQWNGQGHGQGVDQREGEGHGQGQWQWLGEEQGYLEGRMLQEVEEPKQGRWVDQAQGKGDSSEKSNARDGEASMGTGGGLMVATADGERGEVRGGEVGDGEVGEGCVENGVEREESRDVGASGPVMGEEQGGETGDGASADDSSFNLSFDLLPFAAADGADSDNGAGTFGSDHYADGSSEEDGGGMCSQDTPETGTRGLVNTACGDRCCDDSSCSCSKGGRSSSVKSKITRSKSRRSSGSSWRVVPEEFAVDNRGVTMSLLQSNHNTSSSTHCSSRSSSHNSSHNSSSCNCPSNQMSRMHLEYRALSTSTATSSNGSNSTSTQAVSAEPVEIPDWISLPPGAAVLYPSPRSLELQPPQPSNGPEGSASSIGSQPSEVLRPSHLIVLDGTWPKAKRILCQNPWLLQLPHYHLPPHAAAPSRYGFIRKQPKFGCLSTIEAVVYALQILEPDNCVKLDQLLEVFNSMVIDQVEGMRRNGKSSLIPEDWNAPGTLS